MLSEEMLNRFKYHKPSTAETVISHEFMREAAALYGSLVLEVVPPGREQSLAITKIEEAMFWANAGIARDPENVSI